MGKKRLLITVALGTVYPRGKITTGQAAWQK